MGFLPAGSRPRKCLSRDGTRLTELCYEDYDNGNDDNIDHTRTYFFNSFNNKEDGDEDDNDNCDVDNRYNTTISK